MPQPRAGLDQAADVTPGRQAERVPRWRRRVDTVRTRGACLPNCPYPLLLILVARCEFYKIKRYV